MSEHELLVGDAGVRRHTAAGLDLLFAWVPAMVLVSAVYERGLLLAVLGFFGVFLGYFLISEGLWSTTPGKAIVGLRVLSKDGSPCTSYQVLVRNLLRLLDANPIFLGAIPGALFIMFTNRRQRLGDLVAGTIVCIPPPVQRSERDPIEP